MSNHTLFQIFLSSIAVFVLLAVILLAILTYRAFSLNSALKLKQHRSTAAGFPDLLNYSAEVDDGVIINKDGGFMAAWLYKGSDNASSTEEERENIARNINAALSDLSSGWMIHVDAVRRKAAAYSDKKLDHFPDPVSAAIDAERRNFFTRQGALYEGYFVITATWVPPILAQRKFVEMMFDDDKKSITKTQRAEELINEFKKEIQSFENRLSIPLKLARLKTLKRDTEDGKTATQDDFLSWLNYCATGENHPIDLPSVPMYLDRIIGSKELWTGVIPKLGNKFIQCVSIDGFPADSYPGILSALAELPVQYRWSSRFIFLDRNESLAAYTKYRRKWRQKVRGFLAQVFNVSTGPIDQHAVTMVQDADDAMQEINSGAVGAGYYTSTIVLMDEDRDKVENASLSIKRAINTLHFNARIETLNTLEAFLGSLPGHGVENIRRPLINTLNFADLIPTSTIWPGLDHAPCNLYPPLSPPLMQCVTNGATPFRLNLHVRDLGHTLIFGPTGAGKSTHLALLAAQFLRYQNMKIYSFDKGMSMFPLTKAVGGLHFDVAGDDDQLAFCPLQFLETPSDRAWAAQWIVDILRLNDLVPTPAQINLIVDAITTMFKSEERTLSTFKVIIQDEQITEILKNYTIDGEMGRLLDADHDGLALSSFTTFEIENLMDLAPKYAIPTLLYIFRRIERQLDGSPTVIFLDEAWLMLGHPVFRDKIREWLKVMRKANCAIVMATQSLTDASNSGILDVIVESSATKIFLPNIFARDEDTAQLYSRMGLNKRQIDIIASATPKREYYYTSENGRRLYSLALQHLPLALAFVGSSDKETINEIKQLIALHGEKDWVNFYLQKRGLSLANYQEK